MEVQTPLVIVHLSVVVLPVVTPVTVEVGEAGVVIVPGPLTTVHTPVPGAGEFPASVKFPLLQIAWSGPALAVIGWDTLTVTVAVPEHPFDAVPVTVYVVVAPRLAIGFAIVVELKPVAGLHVYVPPVTDVNVIHKVAF